MIDWVFNEQFHAARVYTHAPNDVPFCVLRNTIATNDLIASYSASPTPSHNRCIHLSLCRLGRLLWVNLFSILVEADSWRWSSVPATFSRTNTMKPKSDVFKLHLGRPAQ